MSIKLPAREYIQTYLYIRTKDSKLKLFKFNQPQEKLYKTIKDVSEAGKPVRVIILKARQLGFSTEAEALIFHRTSTRDLVNSLIVAHKDESTNNLFNMSKLFYEMLPSHLKPYKKASNSKELIFENPTKDEEEKKRKPGLRSKIKVATAGGEGVGRSDTLQNVHISEYAFWQGDKKATLNGILQSVPNTANTMVIIESTANGFDHFKELWDMAVNGESDFIPLFFAWFENSEYRMAIEGDFILTDDEQEQKELYKLDDEQLNWRRWCIKNNCSGDLNLFKQEYPSNAQECFLSTGRPVFDNEKIIKRIEILKQNPIGNRGRLVRDKESVIFKKDNKGNLMIYKEPINSYPYVLGIDIAEGLATGDADAIQVLNNITLEQVATFKDRIDIDIYAEEILKLGNYYNQALLVPEINFSPSIMLNLEKANYSRIYVRQVIDTMTKKMTDRLGWRTDKITRPVIISDLVEYVRDYTDLIYDVETLQEMLVFVKNDKGRPEAMQDKHDDLVMSYAIALGGSTQQAKSLRSFSPDVSKLAPDLREDYYRASPDQRQYLLRKWGVIK